MFNFKSTTYEVIFFISCSNKEVSGTLGKERTIDRQKSPREEEACDTAEDHIETLNGELVTSFTDPHTPIQHEQMYLNNSMQITNNLSQTTGYVLPPNNFSVGSVQMETQISQVTQSPNSNNQLSQVNYFSSGSDVGNFMSCQNVSDDQVSLLTHTSNPSLSPDSDQSISTPSPFTPMPDLRYELDDLDALLSGYQKDAVPIPRNQVDNTMGMFLCFFYILLHNHEY